MLTNWPFVLFTVRWRQKHSVFSSEYNTYLYNKGRFFDCLPIFWSPRCERPEKFYIINAIIVVCIFLWTQIKLGFSRLQQRKAGKLQMRPFRKQLQFLRGLYLLVFLRYLLWLRKILLLSQIPFGTDLKIDFQSDDFQKSTAQTSHQNWLTELDKSVLEIFKLPFDHLPYGIFQKVLNAVEFVTSFIQIIITFSWWCMFWIWKRCWTAK